MTSVSEKILIAKDTLHIWKFEIPDSEERFNHFNKLLSEDEIERAQRFYFHKDRNEYVCSRGFLREVLSKYIEIDPTEIQFDYGKFGKPELASIANHAKIKFNISHSKGQALLAISDSDEIGVDIEYIKNIPEMFEIAKELYTQNENDILKNSGSKTSETFFKIWTRKEAIIKAVGHGLSAPLVMIDVSNEGIIKVDESFKEQSKEFIDCRIMDLLPPDGYSAAVALCGNIKEVNYFTV